MDEAMKRRLIGVLVIVVVVFVISLLLPHPGTVRTDANNQRVTLDLTGKEPEALHAAPTPVPPVIAAAPAAVEKKPDSAATNEGVPPQIEEPPVAPTNMPAESMTDDEPPASKPDKPATAPKPAPPAAKAKVETATASAAPEKTAPPKTEAKPTLKLEDSLKQKPAAAVAKPTEKVPAKTVAKVPEAPAKPASAVAAKPSAKSHWFVQVGAFGEVANAHQVLDKLSAKGLKGLISPLDSDKGTRYRARIGPFATRELAKQAQDRAAKLGYASSSVVED